VAHAAIYVDDD